MRRADMLADPIEQFSQWLQQAIDADAIDATAMTLATAGLDAIPSARIVLLKHFDAGGFCWYTDSRSQKGQQLAANPHAAILFHWRDLNRQVRITGRVEKLPGENADEYFQSRPPSSRLSAAASFQSAPVDGRDSLQNRVDELSRQYPDGNVARPDAWIGYRLIAGEFEFWQGKVNRLHDRILYRPLETGWEMLRLSP